MSSSADTAAGSTRLPATRPLQISYKFRTLVSHDGEPNKLAIQVTTSLPLGDMSNMARPKSTDFPDITLDLDQCEALHGVLDECEQTARELINSGLKGNLTRAVAKFATEKGLANNAPLSTTVSEFTNRLKTGLQDSLGGLIRF